MKPLSHVHFTLALLAGWFTCLSIYGQEDSVLVFNELMYSPGEGGSEWVELVNLHGVDIDVSDWSLDGAVSFTFPKDTVIPGNGYVVIDGVGGGTPGALGIFDGQLDNGGESLRLLNNSGRIMSVLDYNDRGDWPVAPDGSGSSLAKLTPEQVSSEAASWSWSTAKGGTPGARNFEMAPSRGSLLLNEIAGLDEADFFIELALCPCPDPLPDALLPLEGYSLQSSGGGRYTFTNESVPSGGWLVLSGEQLGWDSLEQGERVFLVAPGGLEVLDAAVLRNRTRARYPDGESWYRATEKTPGLANVVTLETAVVINEIMYHHRPTYEGETPEAVYAENPEEWIELVNQGAQPVDLSGWALEEGVRFQFAEGTTLAPGAFLVVARDADALRAIHPDIVIVGDFDGSLSDSTDRVLLVDAMGNPADDVTYVGGGSWPGDADGGGSSLELRHPASDNDKAGNWAASDEASRSVWKEYRYRGRAERPAGTNFPSQWSEFLVGLLDSGECLIDDLSVIENPDGAATELLRNRTFSKTLFGGDGTQDWRFLGNHGGHGRTVIVPDPDDASNTVLHLVATGATEHMHNHLETTLRGNDRVSVGAEYEISFRAKWLSGSPQLHTRLYFNYLPKKTILEQPTVHGTPGAQNSTYDGNLGPAYAGLTHAPAVAKDKVPIAVRIQASDPDGVASMTVHWRKDGATDFEMQPMVSVGGEAYEAMLPGQATKTIFGGFTNGKIHYYVEGKDSLGNVSWWPKAGPESRALIPFEDGRESAGPGHNLRIVMTEADTEFLHEETNVMSNHRMKATLVYQEREVFYDVGVRLKGSQRGRNQNVRVGFSIKLPADHLFHGVHGTIAVDRSGAGDQYSQKEILVKHAINRAGNIPGMMDDLIHVISPREVHTGAAMLLKARYDSEYLDALFDRGSEGRMFEYELIYYPTSLKPGTDLKRPNPDQVTGVNLVNLGPDKETYRWHFLLENNRPADDYSQLMDLLDLFSSSNDPDYLERLRATVDVDQWLRAYAIQNLFGIGDNYSTSSQHNMVMYFPPGQKAMYFPWDMDFTFSRGATEGIVANNDLRNMMEDPVAFRSYYAQMDELLNTVYNEAYMARWAEHYSTFLPRESLTGFVSYIKTRNTTVARLLKSGFDPVPFMISSNDGNDFEVNGSTVTLEGQGYYTVASVSVGDTSYDLTWVDRDRWELTLPLQLGANKITVQARDIRGTTGSIFSPMGSDTITVTNTGGAAAANASNVVLSELMYHPADPSDQERAAGFTSDDDFEFVELHNISEQPVSLQGARFTEGIDFDFTDDTVIPANGYVVIAANAEAFQSRYGNVPILGEYRGQLRNSGETLRLRGADQQVIHEFSYEDGGAWPLAADGQGNSLTLIGNGEMLDLGDGSNWAASSALGGTPGAFEAPAGPNLAFEAWLAARGGAALDDPNGDGITLLEEYGLGLDLGGMEPMAMLVDGVPTFIYDRRTADPVSIKLESSNDLVMWQADSSAVQTEDLGNGVSRVRVAISRSYARLRLEF